jgi:hypothetical protein
MYLIQETFTRNALVRLNSSMLDAQKIAENMLEMAREIGNLNLRAGQAGADAFSSAARKLLEANNPVEFLSLAASVARPDFGAVHAYVEQLGGIASKRLSVLPVFQAFAPTAPTLDVPAPSAAEAPPEALSAALAEASAPAAPAVPSASALVESVVLEAQTVTPVAMELADKPAEPAQPVQPDAPKPADEVLAQAALPIETAPELSKIVKKTAASPAVLEAGVAENKPREKKPPKAALPLKNRAAKLAVPNPQKAKKSGI